LSVWHRIRVSGLVWGAVAAPLVIIVAYYSGFLGVFFVV